METHNTAKRIERETTFESKIRSVLVRFMKRTSMHGLGYIDTSRHLLAKLFWAFLIFCAIVILVIHVYMIFIQFLRRPVNTKVSLGFQNLQFPAITVCNVNIMRRSVLAKHANQEMLDLVEAVKPINVLTSLRQARILSINTTDSNTTSDRTHVEAVEDVFKEAQVFQLKDEDNIFTDLDSTDEWTSGRSLSSSVPFLFRFFYMKLSRHKRRLSGHHLRDMLFSCSFNDKICNRRNFELYQTPTYGNCFTLNTDQLVAKTAGPNGGLTLMLYLQTDEFIEGITNGFGAKVIVHEPGTKALPDQEGIFVAARTETSIGLKKTIISRLGSPYGKCRDGSNFKQKYGIEYTVKLCTLACHANYIWTQCNCWHYMHELIALSSGNRFNICNATREMNCMKHALLKFDKKEIDCNCENACRDVYYTESVSSRQWPSVEYALYLKDIICETRSLNCSALSSPGDASNSFVRLNIFYETLNFESIEEEPLVTTFTFMSSVGGALGLWIGLSMLSMCEVLQLVIELLTCVVYKCLGKPNAKINC